MSSGYSPRWKRILYKTTPFLFNVCPEENYHWKWSRFCWCVDTDDKPVYIRIKNGWLKISIRGNFDYKSRTVFDKKK